MARLVARNSKIDQGVLRARENVKNWPLTVLDFLAISRRFLQSSDDK